MNRTKRVLAAVCIAMAAWLPVFAVEAALAPPAHADTVTVTIAVDLGNNPAIIAV